MPKILITKGPERGRVLRVSSRDKPPTIGRRDADIIIDDSYISKNHARFFMKDDRWFVEDLGSANGTYLNGKLINGPVKLHRNDKIQIGQTKMVVSPTKTHHKRPASQDPQQDLDMDQDQEPVIDADNPPPPTDDQHVQTDSLDASSLLLDVLGDMEVDEAGVIDTDDDDDFIPDFDPLNPKTHRTKKNATGDVDKTAVPPAKKPDAAKGKDKNAK